MYYFLRFKFIDDFINYGFDKVLHAKQFNVVINQTKYNKQ